MNKIKRKFSKEHREKISLSLKRTHQKKEFGFKKGIYMGYGFKKGVYQGHGFKKGLSPMKGLTHVEMYGEKKAKLIKDKFLKKMKGRKFSEEHKKKLSDAKKGKSLSKEHREKLRGENCHFWKGGITYINKQIRTMAEYLKWRSDVFKRDNYHCQHCGGERYLNIHHIIPFAKILKIYNIKTQEEAIKCSLLWDMGNGITYCKDCHTIMERNERESRKIPC